MMVGDQCTNLHSLFISAPTFSRLFEKTYWNDCEALVRQNSNSLRSLTLLEFGQRFADPLHMLWRPLDTCAQHTNLSTLRMQRGKIHAQDLEAFWTICRQLEILELTDMDLTILSAPSDESSTRIEEGDNFENLLRNIQTESSSRHGTIIDGALSVPSTTATITTTTPTPVRFPNLHELKLDRIQLMAKDQMEQLIIQCPMLHTLVWRLNGGTFSMDGFCDYYAAQTWPCLDSLVITGHSNFVNTQEHIRFLQSIKRPFKLLDLYNWAVNQQSFDLLQQGHFKTLTKVDLSAYFPIPGQQGSMIDDSKVAASKRVIVALESCPSLEHIAATVISGQDIIDSRPWVCHQLK
ncbi:hypothetical protein BGX31_003369, partial [Mortierella sp. GBA43]